MSDWLQFRTGVDLNLSRLPRVVRENNCRKQKVVMENFLSLWIRMTRNEIKCLLTQRLLCVVWASQDKERQFPYAALSGFYNQDTVGLLRGADWMSNKIHVSLSLSKDWVIYYVMKLSKYKLQTLDIKHKDELNRWRCKIIWKLWNLSRISFQLQLQEMWNVFRRKPLIFRVRKQIRSRVLSGVYTALMMQNEVWWDTTLCVDR